MPLTLGEARNTLNFKLKPWQTENEAFQGSDLDQALAEAVETYSRSKPIRQIEDLAVIANQATYDFPTGALRVQPCFFTQEEVSVYANTLTDPPLLIDSRFIQFDPESPAVWYRTLMNRRHAARFWLQSVEVDDIQQKIVLSPVPPANTTGKIVVDYFHVLNDDGNSYDTIPDADKRFILQYAEAILIRLLAKAYSLNSNDIGDRTNRGLNLAGYLDGIADKLESEFRGRFKMPVVDRT
jgi:hypothetical protein